MTEPGSNGAERPPLQILYIEDDLAVGLLMKTVVEAHGDKVEIALTGAEGMKLYEAETFDIIIIDYQLPDMTGIDIGRKILMETPDLPLIMITGRGNERLASEALNLGFAEYLVKDSSDVFFELVPSVIEHCWRRLVEARRHRETQDLLSEVSDRFAGLIQLSPDGLMVISGGKVVFANPSMDGVFGDKAANDLPGTKLSEIVQPSVADDIGKFVDDVIDRKRARATFQIENISSNGDTRHLEIAGGYCEFSGEPAAQMVVHDVTERKLIEDELRVAKEAADSANKAKSDFLSSMSHELRTPLNAVLGFSQLLLLDSRDPITESQRKNVGHIMQGGEHLLGLINDLLDFAKIDAGQLRIEMSSCDVAPLIEGAISMTMSMAEGRGVNIDATSAVGLSNTPLIRVDANRFRQVLVNLISNAVKYNRENGDIFIDMKLVEPQRVCVSVRDTGIGIPDELAGGLFEPFNRLNAEGSSIQGTGIGLPISKNLIEMMGGEIGYESTPDVGSTFWVSVSVAETPAA